MYQIAPARRRWPPERLAFREVEVDALQNGVAVDRDTQSARLDDGGPVRG